MHHYIFEHPGKTETIIEAFFPDDSNELWMRVIISLLLLVLGFMANTAVRRIQAINAVNYEILENSSITYIVLNADWTVRYFNHAAEQLLDLRRDRDLGKVLSDLLPDLACTFYKPLRQSMVEKKANSVSGFYPLTDKSLKLQITPTITGITLSIQDVSRERYYRSQMQRYLTIINNSLDGLISINRLGIIETYSNGAEPIFGYKSDEVIGHNISMLMPENHAQHHDAYISHYLRTGNAKLVGIGAYEVQALHKDGSLFDMDLAINETVVNDEVMFIANVRDISQRIKLQKQLEHLSKYDSLTGLPNRALMMDSLDQSMKLASRHNDKLAIMFLDLNGFKQVNDTFGHDVGDQLLVAVANILKQCLRQSDIIARLGGDEFVIILEDIRYRENAAYVASNILEKFNMPIKLSEHEIESSISIGIALFPDDGCSDSELLKHSDMAMYAAKKKSEKGFQFYSEE